MSRSSDFGLYPTVLKQTVISVFLLASLAHAEEKTGWSVGGGGKIYGGAKAACEGFLKETESGGVKYVVERMEDTAAGDKTCWFENANDTEGPAVTQTLIYRVRRKVYEGSPIYSALLAGAHREMTKLEHDLGPGAYYYKQQFVARSYAQAAFLDAYAAQGAKNADKLPDAIAYEHDFKQPKDVLDFSRGADLAEFESAAKKELGEESAERMFSGEVNPAHYYRAFKAFVDTKYKKNKKPGDFKIVMGPDYRHQREVQIRINDNTLVMALEKKAMASLEARFPSKDDVIAALQGYETNTLFTKCVASTKSGACSSWPHAAARMLLQRRKWQATIYYAKTKGNHFHLRIGDVILDGAYLQFDDDIKNDDAKAEAQGRSKLFVGTKLEFIPVLDGFVKPIGKMTGAELFKTYWDTQPMLVGGKLPRIVYRMQSAKPELVGEPMWDPEPSVTN